MKMTVTRVASNTDTTTTPETRNFRVSMVEQQPPSETPGFVMWSPNSCAINITAAEAAHYPVGAVVNIAITVD